MKSNDLAEIDDNDLAQATMSIVDRIRPHLTTILAAIGIGFAAMAAWTLVSSQKAAEKAKAWDECLAAVASRDASRLSGVSTRFPDSAAGVWSQILLADNALSEGARLIFVDKALGRERGEADADRGHDRGQVRTDPVDDRHRRLGEFVVLDLGKVGGLHRGEPPGAGGVAVGRGAEPKNRDWRVAGVKMICGPPRGLRSAARVVDSAHDAPALSISPAATIG